MTNTQNISKMHNIKDDFRHPTEITDTGAIKEMGEIDKKVSSDNRDNFELVTEDYDNRDNISPNYLGDRYGTYGDL